MSWQKVKLKEVLKQYRVQHIVQDDIEYKQVTISKYDGVTYRGTKIGKDIGRKRQFVIDLKKYPNTLMLVRQGVQDGSIGIAPAEVDGCIATENMPMFSVEGIDLEYLRFLLKSPYFYDELNKIETTGSAQKSIHERQILEIEIPLPSLEEQKQFVNELTKLKNCGLEISSELTYQLDLIKQLRQAFLREAMQGKLVRSSELGVGSETGHELLAKIKAEKAQLIAEKKLKKEKELPLITADEIPFEIPEHWTWCRLGEILKEIKYGTSQSCDYDTTKNTPVLRIPNVSNGEISIEDLKYTNLSSKERTELSLEEKDILIIRSNGSRELVGKTVLVKKEFIGFCYAGYLIRLRYNSNLINYKYLWLVTKSPFFREMIETPLRTTVGINNINTEEISLLKVPLPPLHEQEQIVAKLEELLAFCDGLEERIKESQGYNDKLLQQVLREALQG